MMEYIKLKIPLPEYFNNPDTEGTVKWFSNQKGYGFITPDDKSADVFVHHTGIEGVGYKTLTEGAKVQFEAVQGEKGIQATNVRKI